MITYTFENETSDGMAGMSAEQFDALPYGAIRLDPRGVVLAYNAREAQIARRDRNKVLGQNFWAHVAPCTDVASFRGRLDMLAHKGGGTESFDFEFLFPWGRRSVRIRRVWAPNPG